MPDWDNVFKYCTPKYVYIRDAKLGLMKYAFMAMILGYVVVYEILYTCDHLIPHHAQGFGTINMEHPVNDCKPLDQDCLNHYDNIVTLPYCKQFEKKEGGDAATTAAPKATTAAPKAAKGGDDAPKDGDGELEGDGDGDGDGAKLERLLEEDGKKPKNHKDHSSGPGKIGDNISPQKLCRYLDNRRLEWEGSQPSEIFIPTHYKHVVQKFNGDCYDPDSPNDAETGRKKYRCKTAWQTDTQREYYIADIEKFKLRMAHSFSSPAIGKFGVSTDYQGLLAACPTNHPLDVKTDCKRMKIPGTSGKIAPEDIVGLTTAEEAGIPSLHGSASGEDEIEFGELLKVTPVAQRNKLTGSILDAKLPDSFGHKGRSLREVGGMLLLDVNYANDGYMRPGLPVGPEIKPITYMYRPYFVPTTRNEKYQLVERSDYSNKRTIDIWYGVTIKMQFNGRLVAFAWSKVLTALTSGLVLLSMATTIVSALAAYVLPLKEKYGLLMYQLSEDFSDFNVLRNDAKDFKSLKTVFSTGDKLLDSLGEDGTPNKELTNPDIVRILCTTEMRLNRLDGQDPRLVFDTGTEDNKINKCIGQAEKAYYAHAKLGIPAASQANMAFMGRINAGKKMPAE